jgi:hypothetical protein
MRKCSRYGSIGWCSPPHHPTTGGDSWGREHQPTIRKEIKTSIKKVPFKLKKYYFQDIKFFEKHLWQTVPDRDATIRSECKCRDGYSKASIGMDLIEWRRMMRLREKVIVWILELEFMIADWGVG